MSTRAKRLAEYRRRRVVVLNDRLRVPPKTREERRKTYRADRKKSIRKNVEHSIRQAQRRRRLLEFNAKFEERQRKNEEEAKARRDSAMSKLPASARAVYDSLDEINKGAFRSEGVYQKEHVVKAFVDYLKTPVKDACDQYLEPCLFPMLLEYARTDLPPALCFTKSRGYTDREGKSLECTGEARPCVVLSRTIRGPEAELAWRCTSCDIGYRRCTRCEYGMYTSLGELQSLCGRSWRYGDVCSTPGCPTTRRG